MTEHSSSDKMPTISNPELKSELRFAEESKDSGVTTSY